MKLNARRRSALRTSQFAQPKQRKYPIHDRSHAANAKARATQQHNKGNLSGSQMRTIHRKANAVLRRGYADGGLVTKAKPENGILSRAAEGIKAYAKAVSEKKPYVSGEANEKFNAQLEGAFKSAADRVRAGRPITEVKVKSFADGGLVTKARTPESLAKEHGFPTTPPTPAPPTKDIGRVKAEIVSPKPATPLPRKNADTAQMARGKDGGFVKGPGGPTADKVPANLSAGEYVIPADVVKKKGRAHFDNMVRKDHKPVLRRGR